MRIDLETGLFTSDDMGLHCRQGFYYDDRGLETGDYQEATMIEVIVSETTRRWVPLEVSE